MRIASAALVLVVALVSVPAAPRAQDAQTPSFRSGVEALPIDVAVVDDHGQPIRDLLAADFTVRIDGRSRRVVSAQWVAAGANAGAVATPVVPEGFVSNESAPGGRLMVLVVDQPNIPFGEMRPVRDAIDAFIDRLTSSDRVAVVGLGQPPVTTPFVSDKAQLKQAIERIPGQKQQPGGGSTHEIPISAALAIDGGSEATVDQVAARDCTGTERQRAACKQEIRSEAQAIAADARQSGDFTLRGLRDVLTFLKAIDGPKTLMFVSQGFFSDRERGDDVGRITELGTLASAARTSIYSLRLEDSNQITSAKASQPQLDQDDQLMRRYGLETLTAAAGGALFNVTGTGGAVFDRLGLELSGYYLLGLDADARDRDGKPHGIRVDVARPNVVVRAHRTMVAGGGDAAAASVARSPQQIVTAALSSPLPASSLPIRAIAFSFRGLEPAKLRLLIHAEIGSGYTSPQRLPVAYYVFDRNGKSVDGQLTNVRMAPAAPGVPSSLVFTGGASVDPGDYTLKIVVADGERVGSVEMPVHAALLDLGRLRLTELVAGGPVPPVNLLSPSVGARVSFGTVHGYLEAYGPDAATLRVRFEVAAEDRGPAILNAEVQGLLVGEERVIFSQQMPVLALPPGSYRLRALVSQGDSLVTTLGRAFEIAPPVGALVAKNGETAPAAAPGAALYLPIEARDLEHPFDSEAAIRADTLEAFQGRVPAAGRAAFDEGVAHLRKREYRDAEASFKKAVQPDAESSAALAYLGVTYAAAGRDTQAANVWRTAMAGGDDMPQLYAWLGDALMRLRSTGEARPILEEAMLRFPADDRFARPLAMLYATFGKGLDAVRLLERSIAKRQDDQAALFLAVEWIFNAHRGGAVVHDRAEDTRLAHEYAAEYLKTGGLNGPLVRQWLSYLDKEAP